MNRLLCHKKCTVPLLMGQHCYRLTTLRATAAISTGKLDKSQQSCELSLKAGDERHGYQVTKVETVGELNLQAILLTHQKTGAQHLHINRDDTNNVFGVSFRTTPMDSTGVPHILEHTALCGSRKFPVRDPFFKMLNRSAATFMNAMTASDWTMYPFSSQNQTDFRNLMNVYLDAAFFPLLRESDFKQEGWRLEHADVDDDKSSIMFKGIVYNEMKGVFSSQQSVFQEAVQSNLLPSHTYGNCSGGLPAAITDLTWQQLKEFHSSHYHPSNSRFFTYGNLPLEAHLELIDKQILSKFEHLDFDTKVPNQPRWSEPRLVKITCQHNNMLPDPTKQTCLSASFLLCDVQDTYEQSVLSLISSLLVSGETSPFYQSLIESQLGSGYAPTTGFERNTRDTWFSVGLEGVHPDDIEKVSQIITDTLEMVAREGFPSSRVEALLSQIELSLKHETTKFGLNLLMSLTSLWNHDAEPIAALQVNSILSRFKQNLTQNPEYLQQYIRKYFLNNPHRLTVIMNPDESHDVRLAEEEADKLKQLVEKLSEKQREDIYKSGLELLDYQNHEEDISCLPTLRVSDIAQDCVRTAVDHFNFDGVSVQICEQPTNEVVHFRLLADTSNLPTHLRSFLPLFCSLTTKMGAGAMDYKQQSERIDRYTGGLDVSSHIATSPHDLQVYEQGLLFSSYCLVENVPEMFRLWSDIFNSLKLDDLERISMLVKMSAAHMVNSISQSGHQFAMTHSASYLREQNRLQEVLSGLTQVSFLKQLTEEKPEPLLGYLKDIALHLLNKDSVRCSLNAESRHMQDSTKNLEQFLNTLNGSCEADLEPCINSTADLYGSINKTRFPMDFTVNYTGVSVPTTNYTDPDYARTRVLGRLLTNKYLHKEIREKGGAYGGGATGGSPGTLSFYSYRDPNAVQTIEVMKNSADWLSNSSVTQSDVDEAILGIFQQVDAPTSPGSRGMARFLSGIDDNMRQSHREQIRSTTVEELRDVAHKYLGSPSQEGITLIGPDDESLKSDQSWTVDYGDGSLAK